MDRQHQNTMLAQTQMLTWWHTQKGKSMTCSQEFILIFIIVNQDTKTQVWLNQMIQHEFEEEKNIPPTEYIQFMTQILAHTLTSLAHTLAQKQQSMGSFMLVKLSVLSSGWVQDSWVYIWLHPPRLMRAAHSSAPGVGLNTTCLLWHTWNNDDVKLLNQCSSRL